MKKTLTALLAAATMAGALAAATPAAHADGGRIAAGVAGGLLGGALLGAAIANSQPAYVEPACHFERERFWDGYGWRSRRIRVCD
ncbi:MAG: hypothetical protein J0H75_16585 [Rhizobiales bacterium]|nr:hypothetical protein [Hyphomicrobiales bacterium]